MTIEAACREDAASILALQKLCYQSEAALYDDYSIAPLRQSLPEIEAEFDTHLLLKAADGGEIVGSVRARAVGDTCHIGRLIVHPARQGAGIGTRLMQAVEEGFPQVERFELFTGAESLRNLHLYEKLGYRIFRREQVSGRLALVFLEKRIAQ